MSHGAIRQFQSNYETLSTALRALQKSSCPLIQIAEESFRLSYGAWEQMERLAASTSMTLETTIFWNYNVRSFFIAELEYALLLHHAALFLPACKKAGLKFWLREASRAQTFRRQHAEFLCSLRSGNVADEFGFFSSPCIGYFPGALKEKETAGPVLLGRFMALQRYQPFVQDKINLITGS